MTGPVAVIKVKDRFRGRTYVDYLTVVKIGAVWRIVNKAFTTVD
jgi:putative lumazine-binding protein